MLSGFELYPRWVPLCCTSSQSLVRYIENFAPKVSQTEKRFKIAFMFSGRRPRFKEERNVFVKADVVKYVFVYMYLWDFFALKPFHDYSLCSVCILPQPAFYS